MCRLQNIAMRDSQMGQTDNGPSEPICAAVSQSTQ